MGLPMVPTVALLSLVVFAIYRYLIVPAFISPLSRVPNAHWTASFSPAWILYHRLVQDDTPTVHAAHARLGPMIRLAPNELSLNCVEGGIRNIYAGGYEKGDWYAKIFSNYGVQPMFAMPDHGRHSQRKRMLSNIYAKSTLQSSEAMAGISKVLLEDRFVPRLKAIADSGEPREVYDIFSSVMMDGVSGYVFGLENGSDFLRQPGFATKFLKDYKARQIFTFWPQEMPNFMKLMGMVGLDKFFVPAWVHQANRDIESWIQSMCDRAEKSLVAIEAGEKKLASAADHPTTYAQLRTSLLKEARKAEKEVTVEHIVQTDRLGMASEMLDHVLAGFDTSSITMTFLAWELSRPVNLTWQKRLHEEIASLGANKSPKEVDALPVLHGCLMETLRIHTAIPGNQPRMTPKEATLGAPGQAVTGLPAGIRVQSQAWSLHRNPDVFPEPELWQPDRWITSTEEQLKEMHKWFWAFSSGGRMCVGSNLAMLEMKNTMVALWGNFATSIADDSGMVHNGGYLGEPVGKDGKFLSLKFEVL